MSLVHRPRYTVSTPAPANRSVPRWGHISRTVSHYGTVTSVLAVYPPDSTAVERRLAEVNRFFAPLALSGGVVAWIGLCAAGIPPLVAALLLAAVLFPVGVSVSRRAHDIRQRTVTLASSRSGLHEESAQERSQQRRLDTIAEALQDASFACRHGVISRAEFDRAWRAAYAHAGDTIAEPSRR
ncbi:DUF6611 family protein [Microbacterium sp. PMB16]|uniref:DUF6611 family protein n=1 Tax=Microbacterium sp. PMB16 TaxID=3120157 RepID=UPI003F4CABA1